MRDGYKLSSHTAPRVDYTMCTPSTILYTAAPSALLTSDRLILYYFFCSCYMHTVDIQIGKYASSKCMPKKIIKIQHD